MRRFGAVWFFALAGLAPEFAMGGSITVANYSFEQDCHLPANIAGCISSTLPSGWSGYDADTFWPGAAQFPSGVPDGTNVASVGGPNVIFATYSGDLRQTVNATVQANTTYVLSVYVGQRADYPLSGYTVSLQANGVVLASDSSLKPGPGGFLDDIITYQSGSSPAELGQSLVIDLYGTGLTAAGLGGQVEFDDVTLQATPQAQTTPEPGFLMPFGVGLVALLAKLRKYSATTIR